MDRKQLRRTLGSTGWMVLLYSILMFVCLMVTILFESIIGMIIAVAGGNYSFESIYPAAMAAASSAWGYIVTIAVGMIILLAWKKRRFWREEIWAKGKPMNPRDFFALLVVFLSVQLIYQLYFILVETLLNTVGMTVLEGLESMAVTGTDSFSMFLYVGILGPVAEELLCRGLVQRTLMPFGKKIAILGSAFLFGMMHGNLLQIPFAFLVGLILGYVAAEYSIAWAMLLHMINNLVVADMLTRLTAPLGDMATAAVTWSMIILSAIAAVVVLIRRRWEIRGWWHRNPQNPVCIRSFFFSGGVITFTVVMIISTIVTCFSMITPL